MALGSARPPYCLVMFSTDLLHPLATSTIHNDTASFYCEAPLSSLIYSLELMEPSALHNVSSFGDSQGQVSGVTSDFVFMSQAYPFVPLGLNSCP